MSRRTFLLLFAGAAAVIVVASTALYLSREDRGFLRGPEGQELLWSRHSLPLHVVIPQDAQEDWCVPFLDAAQRWNDAAGLQLLTVRCSDQLPEEAGAVVPVTAVTRFDPTETGDAPELPHTRLRFSDTTGEVISAPISLPPVLPGVAGLELRRFVAGHELGHVLGLDHDRLIFGSLMSPEARRFYGAGEVTVDDAERLRSRYGAR